MTELKQDRRGFLKGAAGMAGGAVLASGQQPEGIQHAGAKRALTEKEKLDRIASNTWPIRYIFKGRRALLASSEEVQKMKKKYGEITMLDFPDFTKEKFPGVHHMDLFSGLFGDVTDDSQFVEVALEVNGNKRTTHEFDP
jgi:hypothetical protein